MEPVEAPGSRVYRAASGLAGSAVLAQLIGLAAAPVLARLYPPSAHGVAAAFTAIIHLAVATVPRYDQAILVERNPIAAATVFGVALAIAALTGALASVGVLALKGVLESQFGAPGLALALWLAPLAILGRAVYQPAMQWGYRNGHVSWLASRTILQAVGQVGIQLGLALTPARVVGLPAGITAGHLLGNGSLLRAVLEESAGGLRRLSRRRVAWVAWRHRSFAVYGALSGVLGRVASEMPLLLFVALHGPAAGGQFALALKVVGLPTSLLASAVSQAFLAEGSRMLRQADTALSALFLRTTKILAVTGFAIFGLLAVLAPRIIPLIFSEAWRPAGEFARLMTPWLLAAFIATGTSSALAVLSRPREQYRLDLLRAALAIAPLASSRIAGWEAGTTVLAVALAQTLAHAIQLLWVARAVREAAAIGTPRS